MLYSYEAAEALLALAAERELALERAAELTEEAAVVAEETDEETEVVVVLAVDEAEVLVALDEEEDDEVVEELLRQAATSATYWVQMVEKALKPPFWSVIKPASKPSAMRVQVSMAC